MEHMFMQIFERRDWIAGQLRQQEESYAQSVASNLLAAGGSLPSWLWNAAAGPDAWNTHRPQGLNREKTVPEILYNLPHFTTPMNHATHPSQTFQSDLGVHHRLPHKDEDPCIVMDSYERMHKNKRMKHCDTQKNIIEYSGRMTRSKAARSMNAHQNDGHLRNQKRRIEYSVAKSLNIEKNDHHLRNQSEIECSNRFTRSRMAASMNTDKNSDHLRNQRSAITRSKGSALKNSNIKAPLEPKNLTEEDLNGRWNSHLEESAAVRSNIAQANEVGSFSRAFEQIQRTCTSVGEESPCTRNPSAECQLAEVGSPCRRSPSADDECRIAEEEETEAGGPCHGNPSTERRQTAEEEEMESAIPCCRNPSPELHPKEEHEMAEEEEMEVGSLCRGSLSTELHPMEECEGDCHPKAMEERVPDSPVQNPRVDFSLTRKVNESTGSVVTDEAIVIKRIVQEKDSSERMNSPSLLPLERFSFSCDSSMAISEDIAPELEGFSAEKSFDLPNRAKSGLGGIPSEEMQGAEGSVTCEECSIDEDAEIICNDAKESEVLEKEYPIGDDNDPEFEGFSMEDPILMSGLIFDDPNLQKLSRERSSLLQQLQRSMNKQDLISPDQDTLESARSRVDEGTLKPSNMAKSTEEIESQTLLSNALPAGFHQNRVDNSDDYSLKRKFASKTLPLSSSLFGQRTSKPPLTPPIEKAFLERERNHGGLSCFPIYENSKSLKGSTHDAESRVNREPLTDVTSSYLNSKQKISLKGQPVLEKKATNIVSNVRSFIPLVRQKQAALAPAAGKREVKVKALEAAEVAKRLAEKKEIERKMKKEALKIERMKSEQENARQLELKQRQKEEEMKKKEAAAQARKRQREEEMREKQRKKNCRAAEERESRRKAVSVEAVLEREKSIRSSSCLLQNQNRQSQSYEISPYRDSDDDELHDDKRRRKKKFVPSWVRRESLDGHLLSMREMDPERIFSRKASFNISEVLPYRTRMQLL